MSATPASSAQQRKPMEFDAALRALLMPWRELHLWPPFSWLTPELPVRVLLADGSEAFWLGDRKLDKPAGTRQPAQVAVELPASLRLDCQIPLPPMPASQVREAVALQVRTANPFEASDLAWGWRAQTDASRTSAATAVLASRRSIAQHLDGLSHALGVAVSPEVWAFDHQGLPVVIQGYGEPARQQRAARGRTLAYGLLALTLAIGLAAALTPTVKLKIKARQAEQAYQDAERQMGPLLKQREQLVRTQAELQALRELLGERVDALAVVEQVTQLIPDDTWLQRLQVQGAKVTITGLTPNTAALMNSLSGHIGVRDVKSPAAATRTRDGGRENFTIVLTLSPEPARVAAQATQTGAKP